jgi:hypothetical protein
MILGKRWRTFGDMLLASEDDFASSRLSLKREFDDLDAESSSNL